LRALRLDVVAFRRYNLEEARNICSLIGEGWGVLEFFELLLHITVIDEAIPTYWKVTMENKSRGLHELSRDLNRL
jgi:hypothetical protein